MQQIPFALIITGRPGIGKTELARHIAECDSRFRYISLTDRISQAIKATAGSTDLTTHSDSVEFIEQYGPEIYARVLLDSTTPGTVLDGVRLPLALQLLELSGIQFFHLHLRDQYTNAQQPDTTASTNEITMLDELADLCLTSDRIDFRSPKNLKPLISFISSFGYAQSRWPLPIAA